MLRLPIYNSNEVKLALEFGTIVSEVAKANDVKLTKEIMTRAEKIFLNEIRTKGYKKTALSFIPLILAAFENKD